MKAFHLHESVDSFIIRLCITCINEYTFIAVYFTNRSYFTRQIEKGSLDTCILMNKCASLKAILYKRCNEFKSGSEILCSIETGLN